ncbi:MAG: hypothetical protein IJD42_06695 [Clostridia bacterium]|nr:hypothetical protein [Clostridia bacterium]
MMLLKNKKDVLDIKKTGEYVLETDIDMENIVVSRLVDDFRGTIDGCGHTIRNITVSCNAEYDEQSIALINSMFNATIKNITFENVVFKINDNGYSVHSAALCALCENSRIENVVVKHSCSTQLPLVYESNSSNYSHCCSLTSNAKSKVVLFSYNDKII